MAVEGLGRYIYIHDRLGLLATYKFGCSESFLRRSLDSQSSITSKYVKFILLFQSVYDRQFRCPNVQRSVKFRFKILPCGQSSATPRIIDLLSTHMKRDVRMVLAFNHEDLYACRFSMKLIYLCDSVSCFCKYLLRVLNYRRKSIILFSSRNRDLCL